MTMEISIAFRDADGSYMPHVGAMLSSLRHTQTRSLRVHVLHDESLTEENKEKLRTFWLAEGRDMLFHHINPARCLPGVDENSAIMRPLTFATLYRLFLPQLPALAACPRLLYLDTDIIVDTDLAPLWDFELGDALLGAVPDPCLRGALARKGESHKDQWARNVTRYSLALGIPMGRYFNAGVLLLNLARIREQKLFEAATHMVLTKAQMLHPDQDALNKVFFGKSVDIPEKFNYLLHSSNVDTVQEGVWHYSGPLKPWLKNMPKADRYWHYRALCPWPPVSSPAAP